jgi:hypothetical protein
VVVDRVDSTPAASGAPDRSTRDFWNWHLADIANVPNVRFAPEAAGRKYLLGRARLPNLYNATLAIERLQAEFGDGGSHKNDECACRTADLIATASPRRYQKTANDSGI